MLVNIEQVDIHVNNLLPEDDGFPFYDEDGELDIDHVIYWLGNLDTPTLLELKDSIDGFLGARTIGVASRGACRNQAEPRCGSGRGVPPRDGAAC